MLRLHAMSFFNARGATITDAQNNTTSYQYDARGNRTAVIDPINGPAHPTTFAYDIMNRLTGITYPDGSSVSFGYDYRGRRISVTDQNQKTTTSTEAGAEPRVPGRPKWPMPTASEWANPKVRIPNWRMLVDNETPQAGDVAAFNLDPDPRAWAAPYTGHSGIIVSGPGGCGCLNSVSAHENSVGSSNTQFISDPTPHPIYYRRYTGE